jgi:hypothetical protein
MRSHGEKLIPKSIRNTGVPRNMVFLLANKNGCLIKDVKFVVGRLGGLTTITGRGKLGELCVSIVTSAWDDSKTKFNY